MDSGWILTKFKPTAFRPKSQVEQASQIETMHKIGPGHSFVSVVSKQNISS